ncbi:MAG: hypothetical protein EXS13_13170 [Planctomycetes bacterium]|nr:hypothetical protein [Planctomycetota bacterium]
MGPAIGDGADEFARFAAAVESRDFDAANRASAALDARLRTLGEILTAEPPPTAAEQKVLRDEQAAIPAAFERVLRNPRAPVDLQAKLVASSARAGAEGEKLTLKAIE